jgi:putative glycosyltransferase (exosortase G-associated)
MLDNLLSFWVFWGIWIVVPLLIDGVASITLFVGFFVMRRMQRRTQAGSASRNEVQPVFNLAVPATDGKTYQPVVSIIIPVYNGENALPACIASIKRQDYPADRLEIIAVDNDSRDGTVQVLQRLQTEAWAGQFHWISIPYRGKAHALNAGIHLTTGQYIINIDADVVLDKNAVRSVISTFEQNPKISAATGGIQVLPADPADGRLRRVIAECEFQEYMSAFWMGRQYQSLTNSLFTMAGAFSIFRREALLQTFLYDNQTVSEDTKLTLDFYRQLKNARIVCIANAIAYISPTRSLSALYAQRVRWQRGQLEVAALNPERIHPNFFQIRGLSLSRLLMIDHTLLFPRLVWMFLFPLMIFFDYSISLVISATLLMYGFYAAINGLTSLGMYMIAGPSEKERLRRNWWIPLVMPAYRSFVFLCRLAGSIIVMTEQPEWRVTDPLAETRQAIQQTTSNLRQRFSKR